MFAGGWGVCMSHGVAAGRKRPRRRWEPPALFDGKGLKIHRREGPDPGRGAGREQRGAGGVAAGSGSDRCRLRGSAPRRSAPAGRPSAALPAGRAVERSRGGVGGVSARPAAPLPSQWVHLAKSPVGRGEQRAFRGGVRPFGRRAAGLRQPAPRFPSKEQ